MITTTCPNCGCIEFDHDGDCLGCREPGVVQATAPIPTSFEVHPVAACFPMMPQAEYEQLRDDIKDHGQQEPLTFWRGKLIDGRNRLKACEELGIEPSVSELDDDADPVAFVISANLRRRQLTESQRAMVAAGLRDYYDRQAKERLKTNVGGKHGGVPMENLPQAQGTARDQAGAKLHVSGKTVDFATKVIEKGDPKLAEAVEAGEVSVSAAAKLTTLPKAEQREILKGGKKAVQAAINQKGARGNDGRGIVRNPASSAMQFAVMSISQLERIQDNDGDRAKAFAKVEAWIAKRNPQAAAQSFGQLLRDTIQTLWSAHPEVPGVALSDLLQDIAGEVMEASTK